MEAIAYCMVLAIGIITKLYEHKKEVKSFITHNLWNAFLALQNILTEGVKHVKWRNIRESKINTKSSMTGFIDNLITDL